MRIIGIDPGLRKTGWGVIEKEGNRLKFLGCGLVRSNNKLSLAGRLSEIDQGLAAAIKLWKPEFASVEETFVNRNPASALLLGQARGAAIVCVAREGVPVFEYSANFVKKSIVGNGHATKDQIGMMIKVLLPKATPSSEDEADALAIAICHAHNSGNIQNKQ